MSCDAKPPSTACLCGLRAGALLKEAVDDLEWAAAGGHQSARSAVHLVIRRDPRALTMFAKGAGELKASALERCTSCDVDAEAAAQISFRKELSRPGKLGGTRSGLLLLSILPKGLAFVLALVAQ